jgi:SAM-dependent methyltransferase
VSAPGNSKVSGDTVRDDFNAISTVIHYTKAAHDLGLWKSELVLIREYFPDKEAHLLEAGCGAGRVAVGLWQHGYRRITAFDFAAELVDQAVSLAEERQATGLTFLQADATQPLLPLLYSPDPSPQKQDPGRLAPFDGVLFMFNGLMQIPGRENRRRALRNLQGVSRPGAPLLFTTHDRDDPKEAKEWAKEAERWARGEQNPRLLEFGDRYFTDDTGNTFMHLPDRREILEDLAATGWTPVHDRMRDELASETPRVRNFSDNCRFWVARRG